MRVHCIGPSDPTLNFWRVSITDCSGPDTITVHIEDLPTDLASERREIANQDFHELRLICTDENAQVGVVDDTIIWSSLLAHHYKNWREFSWNCYQHTTDFFSKVGPGKDVDHPLIKYMVADLA